MNSKAFILILSLLCVTAFGSVQAQDSVKTAKKMQKKNQKKLKFVDKNGDGYNDNAPDHDNDGIPNELDPDWHRLMKEKNKLRKPKFIDLNGDGINDNLQKISLKQGKQVKIIKSENGSSINNKQQGPKGMGKKKKGGKE